MKLLKNGLEVLKVDGYKFGYEDPMPSTYKGFGIYDHTHGGFICLISCENPPAYSPEFQNVTEGLEQKGLTVFSDGYGPYCSKTHKIASGVAESLSKEDLQTVGIARPID